MLGLEITNGVIAVIGGLILWGINRIFRWTRSIDDRLDNLERAELERGRGTSQGGPGRGGAP